MSTQELKQNARRLAGLLKVIADPERLRILALLAEQSCSDAALSRQTDLSTATINQHVRKLLDSGIVTASGGSPAQTYSLNTELLLSLRQTPLDEAAPDPLSSGSGPNDDSARLKVVRNFFDGDRLKSIPARQQQKRIVLEHLVRKFEPDRKYPEREVNGILRNAHDDVASLRRYLIDFGFMTRERGIYRVVSDEAHQQDSTKTL